MTKLSDSRGGLAIRIGFLSLMGRTFSILDRLPNLIKWLRALNPLKFNQKGPNVDGFSILTLFRPNYTNKVNLA